MGDRVSTTRGGNGDIDESGGTLRYFEAAPAFLDWEGDGDTDESSGTLQFTIAQFTEVLGISYIAW